MLIDEGAAETRAVRVVDGVVRGFWFGPTPDDPFGEAPLDVGDILKGRVADIAPALGGAFIDLGADGRGFLAAKRALGKLIEGAVIVVRVRRAADGRKGAELDGDWKAGLSSAVRSQIEGAVEGAIGPGRLGPFVSPAARVFGVWPAADLDFVTCSDPDTGREIQAALGGSSLEVETNSDAAWTDETESLLETSLRRSLRAGEAVFTFDEGEAGTLVDIDRAADAKTARGRGEGAFLNAAAAFLSAELDRRAIGGVVGVDFPAPTNAGARQELARAVRRLGRVEEVGRDGFVRLTRPRRMRSLLERATELSPTAPDEARAARRFTLDWRAKAAMRALETRARARASARFALRAPAQILSYIAERPHWMTRLTARHGARFELGEPREQGGAGHDVVER
ncbi:MAG: hypothetical protein AAFX08_03795 [Pseudomonadota bacterium]